MSVVYALGLVIVLVRSARNLWQFLIQPSFQSGADSLMTSRTIGYQAVVTILTPFAVKALLVGYRIFNVVAWRGLLHIEPTTRASKLVRYLGLGVIAAGVLGPLLYVVCGLLILLLLGGASVLGLKDAYGFAFLLTGILVKFAASAMDVLTRFTFSGIMLFEASRLLCLELKFRRSS